jgi:hypothetical protein
MKQMKKLLLLLSLLGIGSVGYIFAQQTPDNTGDGQVEEQTTDDLDLGEDLNLDELDELDDTGDLDELDMEDTGDELETFGYTDQDEIKVKEVGPDYVVLEVPVVKLDNGDVIRQYKVYYSTESLANGNVDATKIKSKTFTFDVIDGDTVELKLDNLSPNTTYYAVVVPVNADDVEGSQSKEISFTTKPVAQPEPEQHPAAEVEIKNVTYTISGNKVTVKWSPVQGADKIEIYMKSINDENYEKVATVPANTTSYVVEVAKPGEYQVKLTPTDKEGVPVGKDYILTVKVASVPKKAPKKAPKVGPETNIIIMLLILASIAYFAVRYRKY